MDKKTFKKFQHTLDPTLLENLPEHIFHEEFDYVFSQKDNLNIAWINILYNHFSEYSRSEIANLTELANNRKLFISGSMSLTKHESKEYEKTIYIFGDMHGRTDACNEQDKPLTILKFFETYTENIDKFIDIYLESSYIKTEFGEEIKFNRPEYREKFHGAGFLPDVKYLLPDRPNIRIHRSDLRDYFKNFTHSKVLIKIAHHYDFIKVTQKELKQFLNYSNKTFQEMLLSKPIIKQLKKIADKTLVEKILQFMVNEIPEKMSCDTDFLNLLKDGIRESIDKNIPVEEVFKKYPYKNIYYLRIFSICTTLIMDMYLITRLFKTHEVKSDDFRPTKAKNVFIYVGDVHAERYRRFLGSIGFSHENIAKQENKRCIRVFKPIVF